MSGTGQETSLQNVTQPPVTERFSETIGELSVFIVDLVTEVEKNTGHKTVDPKLIKLASFMIGAIDKNELIEGFIGHSYLHWEQIRLQNRDFFAENGADIFKNLPMKEVDNFKRLFTTKDRTGEFLVCGDNSDILWEYFGALVKMSIKYIHEKRKPFTSIDDGKEVHDYSVSFMDNVNVENCVGLWKIKLLWPKAS
jgi:hypothetical protein